MRTKDRSLLFIDLDGVLLRRRNAGVFDGFELAPGCVEFLEAVTSRFQCRWLSSRARTGWPDGVRRAFRAAGAPLDDPRWAVLGLVEPAVWSIDKTEALNPESDFWWIDDAPSEQDRAWLLVHGCDERLIEISTDANPDALIRLIRLWDQDVGKRFRPK